MALHMSIDLFNREIVGYSTGKNKDANLVSKVISKINHNLKQIRLFTPKNNNSPHKNSE